MENNINRVPKGVTQAEQGPSAAPRSEVLAKPPERMQAQEQSRADRTAHDRRQAGELLDKMKADAPQQPLTDPAYESAMEKERAAFARQFEYKAKQRNKNRTFGEKLLGIFGIGKKATPEMLAQEDAQEIYTEVSNARRFPKVYGRGGKAEVVREGTSDSRLAQLAVEDQLGYGSRHEENHPADMPTWKMSANLDERIVRSEIERRKEKGLPTDILDNDIYFAQAQEREREGRKGKSSPAEG